MRSNANEKACQYRTLSNNGVARVQSCVDCGTVSLHMGAVSLRFDPVALESLWSTIGEALIVLHDHARREPHRSLAKVRPIGDA